MESARHTAVRSTHVKFFPIIGAAAGLTVIGALVAYFGADAVVGSLLAQNAQPAAQVAPAEKLVSGVYDWEKLAVTPNAKGVRRAVCHGSAPYIHK